MAGKQQRTSLRVGSALLLGLACAPVGRAQHEGAALGDPLATLKAEIRDVSAVYHPNQPMRLRFALHNPSDDPVEIPLTRPPETAEGILLPKELIVGTTGQPALYVLYEDEKAVAVRAEPAPTTNGSPNLLRLGPHGSVGADVDLRTLHRRIRYNGVYRLEWRPLGGRVGTVTAQFRVEPPQDAIIVTDYGKVTFTLLYEKAPQNVENFLELARDGFYDGKTLHRIVPGFLIQGGCSHGDGTGVRPDGKLIPAEFHDAPLELGTLAMARKPNDPNSASCQFFIVLGRAAELDGQYTVIGQARNDESFRTLQQLASLPTDEKHRPLRPVLIRSVTLDDVEVRGRSQLETLRP